MKIEKKPSLWVIIGLVMIAICVILSILFILKKNKKTENEDIVAVISIQGIEILEVNLTQQKDMVIDLNEAFSVPVKLEVKDHQIRFMEVSCPDKVCESHGFLKNNLDIAICMPNKTIVMLETLSKSSNE